MMNSMQGSGMMGGMWLLWLLFWVVVIAGIVLVARWLIGRPGQGQTCPPEAPLDVLKKRYARGEIDSASFEKMKQDIEG
ncbi:SHOCT domain-containing protein [Rhodoferax sp.]|uniref:SHOCT domain-containing protein n=1 Tax=Rhodoferax sp. TaxID=50421 RepID=UPI0019F3757D|nr:SHOCT domain-containing protein [Rhodoferax sp.]MBE0472635.1 SHOCT domain-containing protein [Rhodoferax sp.]